MKSLSRSIVNISFAKQALHQDSREYNRFKSYAGRFDLFVVLVLTTEKDALPTNIEDGSLRVIGVHAANKISCFVKACWLLRTVLKNKPQHSTWIVSAQDALVTSVIARIGAIGRTVSHQVQVHGDICNKLVYKNYVSWVLHRTMSLYFVRSADAVRVVSERIKRSLVQYDVPAHKITVLPIQSDVNRFLTAGNSEKNADDATPFTFLYVGRFAPEKNVLLLLQAFAKVVKSSDTPVRLRLVGEGRCTEQLLSYIKAETIADAVEIVPWTQDVVAEMQQADAFCLSSNHEGWGMVLVEAAAIGLPIVTTDVGCAGEFIYDKETGLVVPVGDVSAYAAAMSALIQDPELRDHLAHNAKQAATDFALPAEEYIDQFVEAYSF